MMRRFSEGWFPLLGGIFSCLCVNGPAGASPITFEFGGEVTFVGDENGVLPDTVVPGTPFTGAFTFESSTPDTGPGKSGQAFYNDALLDISGTLGSFMFDGPQGTGNFIAVVLDSFFDVGTDSYAVRAGITLLTHPVRFRLTLVDSTGLVFDDTSLPLLHPRLGDFDGMTFSIFSEAPELSFSVGGEITSLVPEPVTVLLLSVGSAWAIRKRTKHRKSAPTRVRSCGRSDRREQPASKIYVTRYPRRSRA